MTSIREKVTVLDSTIAELVDRARQAAEHLARLDEKIARSTMALSAMASETPSHRIRRGTLPPPVAETLALVPTPLHTLESLLRSRPMGVTEIAVSLRTAPAKAHALIQAAGDKIANVGSEKRPRYFWRVGDESSTEELSRAVETLLTNGPISFPELLNATGARRARVSGRIVDLQRRGRKVENRGSARKALWFLPP